MLTRLFVIVGGLLVLVLLAALVVPPFVDWTNYKSDFEREASAVLGRRVTVHGTAKARLLPFPSVTFSDVSVAGGPDGQPAMTVDTFSMDAELAPFLRGEALIFDMRLVKPKAMIDVAADGTVDWTVRPSSPFDPGQVTIEKLTVTDGEVTLRHAAGGRTHRLSHIDAVVSAKTLAGPWRMDGALDLDGLATKVSASTGRADGSGSVGLRLHIDPQAYPLAIETEGKAGLENGALAYSGKVRITGEDRNKVELRGTSPGETVKASGAGAPSFRLSGDFRLNHRTFAIDRFRFETGPLDDPYTADGKASVDLGARPRFAIEATGAQVEFDEAVGKTGEGAFTLAQRVAALERALRDLPRPTIPGSIDVTLPAVLAGDTTIRDVRLAAEPAPGGWGIKSLAAMLPGRTRLEASGLLNVNETFGFSGSLLLAVAQPSGFAAWLSKDVDEAIRRLPAAGFNAKVDLTDTRQTFSDLELVLGKAKFRGHVDATEPADSRPSVEMRLEGGEMDVEGLTAFASLFVSDKGANRFADSDLDFQVKAGPVAVAGLTADTVDTALRLRSGVLEIDRLSVGGLAGAEISATGRIRDFPSKPTGNLDASVIAVDLAPLVDMAAHRYAGNAAIEGLAQRIRAYPDLLKDARIDLVASVADNDDGTTGLALSAKGNAGGSALSASLSGQGKPDRPLDAALTATFTASNNDATALLALYGLPALPLGLVGQATTDLSAKGTLAGGLATAFSVTGQDFKARFDGTVSETAQGPAARGKASLDAADIEPWLMTTGVALPGMGTGTSLSLSADADYANGLLVLSRLDGAVNEAAVSGDINAELRQGQPHLTGALALDELDLGQFAAMLYGDAAFSGNGKDWPTTPFSRKSGAPLSAELDLTAGSMTAGAVATAYDAALHLALDAQGVHVSDMKATLFGGAFAGLFDLKNNDGTGLFNGQFSLTGADIATALPDAGLTGSVTASAALSSSGKSVDSMMASLSGSGTAATKGLTIAGLKPDALPAIIGQADRIGRDIDAARTAAFAPSLATAGAFAAADADIAFTVANGVVRAPPLTLQNPAAAISTSLSADLATGDIRAEGAITYRPGDEALVGSEPAVSFTVSGQPGETVRTLDTGPLAQFLTQRALEKEQRRVEAMQAALLEKQRLRREARYYASLQDARDKAEEHRLLEEMRVKAEQEARERARQAAADAQAKTQAEAQVEADARAKADAEAKAKADAEAKAAAEKARQATQPAPDIQRAPLPPSRPPAVPEGKTLLPFSMDGAVFDTQ
ncbi:AsmA-like C-terminal region-containing protein [Mesorhizobium sp. CN5-321]|jgi:uncharacterized protein involved in outer membrane biogenesis|uniref:AsmA family protein n=1 Tax=Mesorhizobium hunchu TaxID=3157708 RepID=UPI0032B8206C